MSFFRHEGIFRPISSSGSKLRQPSWDCPGLHWYDELPAGDSLVGCAPAEPASASPAEAHRAAKAVGSTIEKQRTPNYLLTACLTQGDNPRWIPRPRILHPCPTARFAATHPW